MEVKVLEIAFVAYSVTDLPRARKFYEGTLGLTKSRVFGDENTTGWVEYDIGPTTLAIGNMVPQWSPSRDGGVVGFEVESMDAAVAKLKADGAGFITPTVMETPVCYMLVIQDPDGNAITIHKRKVAH